MPHQVSNFPELFGFRNGDKGVHTGRSIMLTDLELLLRAALSDSTRTQYGNAIVRDNVLGKGTATARFHADKKLLTLYGLDPKVTLFRLLRLFWDADPEGRPLLAILCACARDPILRCTAETVLAVPVGSPLEKEKLAGALNANWPSHFAPTTMKSMLSNLSSSWTQSGHLKGKTGKTRSSPLPSVGATAYALVMGHLCGARGQFLFSTLWARMLDRPEPMLRELAQKASQRGWLRYRSVGEVTDITFDEVLTETERGALSEPT